MYRFEHNNAESEEDQIREEGRRRYDKPLKGRRTKLRRNGKLSQRDLKLKEAFMEKETTTVKLREERDGKEKKASRRESDGTCRR